MAEGAFDNLSPTFDEADLDFGLDFDTFLTAASPADASAPLHPPPPLTAPPACGAVLSHQKPSRAHPLLRHRRCLFGSPPPSQPSSPASAPPHPPPSDKSRKRGMYNCGKCGQPKRGHVCPGDSTPTSKSSPLVLQQLNLKRPEAISDDHDPASSAFGPSTPAVVVRDHGAILHSKRPRTCSPFRRLQEPIYPRLPPSSSSPILPSSSSTTSSCSSNERLYRRAALAEANAASEAFAVSATAPVDADFSFSTDSNFCPEACNVEHQEQEIMPLGCMVQILSRLSPRDLVSASGVSRRWRQCAEHVWTAKRSIRICIDGSSSGYEDFLPYILRKCASLSELTLETASHVGDSLLKCIVSLNPYLSSVEVSLKPGGKNGITGEGMRDLFRHCKSLKCLKLEGCRRMTELELSSLCLETLWLTGCQQLKFMFLNCTQLSELSIDFLPLGGGCKNDEAKAEDLAAIMRNVGKTARGLKRLHVASHLLHDRVIIDLMSSELKHLRMLSLTFGSGITDASVAAIVSNCQWLELLDLSGSYISDRGLEMIGRTYSSSLKKLLIALCPRVSHVGIQLAASQLPRLEILDCGKVVVDNLDVKTSDLSDPLEFEDNADSVKTKFSALKIGHQQLQKLSLWGCSALQILSLDCPSLIDLNLTGCSKLRPDQLRLFCPSLKDVHVGKCEKEFIHEVQHQMEIAFLDDEKAVWRRQADRSKRIHAPCIPYICSTP